MAKAAPILFGFHPVREALRAQRRKIRTVYLGPGKGAGRRQEIAEMARQTGTPVQWMSAQELSDLVGHARHQDVAALASEYPVCSLEEILSAAARSNAPWVLLLDQIVDPQNFGAIVRTAHCAGMNGVVVPKDRSAPPTPAVSRASAGALEHMRISYVTNLVNAMQVLKEKGFWIAGADGHARQSVYDADLNGPLALVIGGEEKGMRPLVQQHCDFLLAIPQAGLVGSLNASAAAAVIIYEAFRQRGAGLQ